MHRLAPLSLLLAACAVSPDGSSEPIPSFEEFFDGKTDTGYVGTRAAELEAVLRGKVRVELPGRSAAELEVGSSRVDLQACKLEYSIVSPK